MKDICVGLIGTGSIAHIRYIPSIAAADGISIAAICDMNPQVAAKVGGELNVPHYCNADEFLNLDFLDAVVLTTYHPERAAMIVKSLAAGKHVLAEKPVAVSVEDMKMIQDAAKKSDKILFALPYNGYPYVDLIKKYIADGVIGDVSSVDGNFAHLGPTHAPWFFDKKKAKWGVLADLGIYLIAMYAYLFGPIKRITGTVKRFYDERKSSDGARFPVTVDDNCAAIFDWGDGKIGVMKCNWVTGTAHPGCIWDLRISGTKGVIFLNMVAPEDNLMIYSPSQPLPGLIPRKEHGQEGYYLPPKLETNIDGAIVRAFVEAINHPEKNACAGCSLEMQAHVIEVISKLYESSQRDCSVEIESRF